MEGPGGYQLVGRTVPVWRHRPGSGEPPWLLRQFDLVRFRPVTPDALADLRSDIEAGRRDLEVASATFSLAEATVLEDRHADEIARLRRRRRRAFDAERERWSAAGRRS
jgi:urea carboxylase